MLGEARYHLQATGKKAGHWVLCNAKQACRLGGEHIDRQAADFINRLTDSRNAAASIENIDDLKGELAALDAATEHLYDASNLPEGVSVNTVSTLEYTYDALDENAKNKAYDNWLANQTFEYESEAIREYLMENENNEGFTPENVNVFDEYGWQAEFDGNIKFSEEEAAEIVKNLDDEEVEDLEVYSGFETREDIYNSLVKDGVDIVYPARWNSDGLFTSAGRSTDYYLAESPILKAKLATQAARYKSRASVEMEHYQSKDYFEESVRANEVSFDEYGN